MYDTNTENNPDLSAGRRAAATGSSQAWLMLIYPAKL